MQDQEAAQPETKCIVYEQPHNSLQFPMVITAFDGDYSEFAQESGFRGRYVFFSFADGGINDSFHDPYSVSNPISNSELKQFLLDVRAGWKTGGDRGIPWEDLEHDGVYTRDDFDSVKGI